MGSVALDGVYAKVRWAANKTSRMRQWSKCYQTTGKLLRSGSSSVNPFSMIYLFLNYLKVFFQESIPRLISLPFCLNFKDLNTASMDHSKGGWGKNEKFSVWPPINVKNVYLNFPFFCLGIQCKIVLSLALQGSIRYSVRK